MEIVQRLALGPKQGIAVIRVGDRHVAVSVGEGGIHRLFELEASDLIQPTLAIVEPSPSARPATSALDFKSVLKGALKNAGLVVAFLIAGAVGTSAASAQAAPPTTPVTTPSPRRSATRLPALRRLLRRRPRRQTGRRDGGGRRKTIDGPVAIVGLVPQMDWVGNGDGLHLSGTVGIAPDGHHDAAPGPLC
jgi:hypothetical protein